MSIPFYKTGFGNAFFRKDFPDLIKNLSKLNESLQNIDELSKTLNNFKKTIEKLNETLKNAIALIKHQKSI